MIMDMDFTMKLLSLILLLAFGLTTYIEAADRSSTPRARSKSPSGRNSPAVAASSVAASMMDRAAIEAAWEKDLYPYQVADVRRACASVPDADFFEFAALANKLLTPITSNDANDRNSTAGFNARIIVHFASASKEFWRALTERAEHEFVGATEDEKPEIIEKIIKVGLSNPSNFDIFTTHTKHFTGSMSVFDKTELANHLNKLSHDCMRAFLEVVKVVSPVFFTPEYKIALCKRLSSIVDERNKADFMAVAAIPLEVFQAVEAHLRDGNRMINFIVDLINKNPQERQAFIAANMG